MTYVVLDIGAGARAFGLDLARLNPQKRMLVFCGEPSWGWGPFFRPITLERAEGLISQNVRGVKRIDASYDDFRLSAHSLDLVTLNSPHPFSSVFMRNMERELERCLKPGGLFLSSYPRYDLGRQPGNFELLAEGRWERRSNVTQALDEVVSFIFPQSPILKQNIRVHTWGDPRSLGTSYIYYDGILPGYRLWRKP